MGLPGGKLVLFWGVCCDPPLRSEHECELLWHCVMTSLLGRMIPGLARLIRREAMMVLSPDMVETLLRHGTYTEKLLSLARVRGCPWRVLILIDV